LVGTLRGPTAPPPPLPPPAALWIGFGMMFVPTLYFIK
jgi:hypothetical protein